jgi:two-component system, OmpR family, sensor kinase
MSTRQKRQRRMRSPRTIPCKSSSPGLRHSDRETALEERIAELEQELKARDDFLAFAAHELRNPMTPISAQIELLLARARNAAKVLPNEVAQGLEQLHQLVEAYMRRATTFLEVSRITSGNLRLQIAETDISGLIRQVTANLMPMAERAGCQIRLNVEDGIVAQCDRMAMEQILENLLSNAVRYGSGNPIEIALRRDGRMTQLSVGDQGIGISEEDQARLFERFHNLRTSPTGGFGVGLWVTCQITRTMEGEITVSSSPGKGSVFTVRLPLRPGGEDNAH